GPGPSVNREARLPHREAGVRARRRRRAPGHAGRRGRGPAPLGLALH
ncbi:MAG: hypothetical protein AVDCRST_MAG30-128, partial [uncultured Solirubrobacteraceae bacterium]